NGDVMDIRRERRNRLRRIIGGFDGTTNRRLVGAYRQWLPDVRQGQVLRHDVVVAYRMAAAGPARLAQQAITGVVFDDVARDHVVDAVHRFATDHDPVAVCEGCIDNL